MSLWRRLFGGGMESNSFYLPHGTDGDIGLIPSPDSTRLAYVVQGRIGKHVEVNGQGFRNYHSVAGITFSADSRHIAYAAYRDNRMFVVFDENEYETWDDIGKTSPVISPDARHVAYTARRGHAWFAVMDGQVIGGPYDGFGAGGIMFSPNSQRLVYIIERGNSWLAVVDGEEQQPFPGILIGSQTFSSNSEKVAYVAGIKGLNMGNAFVGEQAVIINDEIQQLWKVDATTNKDGLMSDIYFSPDSKRFAYGVKQNGSSLIVLDGVPQKKYDGIISGWRGSLDWARHPDYGKASCKSDFIVFSPDSRHVAYAAAEGGKALLVYDGEEKGRHQGIHNCPVVFSPDSNRLAYGINKGSKQLQVVDWTEMEAFDAIPAAQPSFSPDSEHIAYFGWKEKGNQSLFVIDSQGQQLQASGIVIGAKLVWDDSKHLHALVTKGRKIIVARFEVN